MKITVSLLKLFMYERYMDIYIWRDTTVATLIVLIESIISNLPFFLKQVR